MRDRSTIRLLVDNCIWVWGRTPELSRLADALEKDRGSIVDYVLDGLEQYPDDYGLDAVRFLILQFAIQKSGNDIGLESLLHD